MCFDWKRRRKPNWGVVHQSPWGRFELRDGRIGYGCALGALLENARVLVEGAA